MRFKAEGTVHHISQLERIGAKKTFKNTVVLMVQQDDGFAKYLPFTCFGKLAEQTSDLAVGDEVQFSAKVSGSKWQKDERSDVRYFAEFVAIGFTVQGGY